MVAEEIMSCTIAHESQDTNTLCFECYRAERDRRRASAPATSPVEDARSPFVPPLTERQVAHRQAMLDFARSRRA